MICTGCGARFDDADVCGLCGADAPPGLDDLDAFEAVNVLFEAVRKWDPMVALDEVGPSVDRAAWLLARVRDGVEALRLADAALTSFIADILPTKQPYPVDGVGAVTVRFGSARSAWDSDGLLPAVVAAICEGDVDEIERARPIIDAFLVFARPDWRVTPLRAAEIDPDEFCEKRPGRPAVIIE